MQDEFPTRVLAKQASAEHDELTTHIVEDMHRRSLQGKCPRAEEYLEKHPELRESSDALLRIIYEEYCIRQEHGEAVTPAEYIERFPQWQHRLKALLECHRLLVPEPPTCAELAQVAECGGEFRVVGELGKGSEGQVFLALQTTLANRPVVLKVAPAEGQEHLTLARLQHTHIVPLYALYEDPFAQHRILCMPFLGGATLEQLLDHLRPIHLEKRTGKDLLAALDGMQANCPVQLAAQGPGRAYLARLDFAHAICWIGACLAEGLAFAHQRELVHLDVKPSNILITADAQPMLLDFHIAQKPVLADGKSPTWIGGTPRFASPEQLRAMSAMSMGASIKEVVGGPSDLYSLGVVLYKALGGELPLPDGTAPPRLDLLNPQVSPGLADIIAKCLEPGTADRYPNAHALAEDLRRHLRHQLLQGVRNRSWKEGWRKWRVRRPFALHLIVMLLAVLGAAGTFGVLILKNLAEDRRRAESALVRGEDQMQRANYADAQAEFLRGAELASGLPGAANLHEALLRRADASRQMQRIENLHRLAEQVRLHAGSPSKVLERMEEQWQKLWQERRPLLDFATEQMELSQRTRLQTDLHDLALLWAGASLFGEKGAEMSTLLRTARLLREIEEQFGASHMLWLLRSQVADLSGKYHEAEEARKKAERVLPRTSWEYAALGRILLAKGKLSDARLALDRAASLQPDGFWANFYLGLCAYRQGDLTEAEASFRASLSLSPLNAVCHFNRGLALAGLKKQDQAMKAFTRAIELNPSLGNAYVQRAALHIEAGHFPPAFSDLRMAGSKNVDQAELHFRLAQVHHRTGQTAQAREYASRALAENREHAGALALVQELGMSD